MRVRRILGLVGQLLRAFCPAFLPPAALAAWEADWVSMVHFLVALFAAFTVGSLLAALGRDLTAKPFRRAEALAVVSVTWLTIANFCAIPYVLEGLSPEDAMFESMSGLTTTGATILTDFGAHGRAFFLWRAMTQWFGGLGVIALFIVVLPRLGIAGRQLFFAEASGAPGEAVSPQARTSASKLWILYGGLTLLLAVLLIALGMGPYDAFCHALTTMSAGGFSPNGESIAGFHNPAIEWLLTPFMLIAGTSFALSFKVLRHPGALFRDGEFRVYFLVCALLGVGLAISLTKGAPTEESLRQGLFQSASLMSSTGFASVDYNLWDDRAKVLLVLAMLVGGCAGSAAGGPKVVRLVLVGKHVIREIRRVLHPRAVLPLKYQEHAVSSEIMRAVFTLVVLFFVGHVAIGVALVLMGSDLVVGFTAALACFGNVGPAFGHAGPMGSFAAFSVPAKVLLTIAMWLGRLEIVTVLALLHPDVWSDVRWK